MSTGTLHAEYEYAAPAHKQVQTDKHTHTRLVSTKTEEAFRQSVFKHTSIDRCFSGHKPLVIKH